MAKELADALWLRACGHLKQTLSKDIFDRWISVIGAHSLADDTLVLCVANDFYQTWLEENYVPLIQDAVILAHGQPLKIKLVVDHASTIAAADDIPVVQKHGSREKAHKMSTPLNPKYTFDTFVVGPSNNFAHGASLAVAQSPGRAYNPLFLYGGVGLGKTHLMQAIGHQVVAHGRTVVCYQTCEGFTNDYIDALTRKELVQFRKKYRSCDVLMIDDIQFLGGKERMQEEFFHTFNALFDGHKQIILNSDRPASEIPSLEHRLVSRFEWGLVTELEPPDVETRIAILRKKQVQLNVTLADDVIMYLAQRIRANIRRLEGALIRVVSYGSLTGKPVTVETLDYLLRDTLDQEQQETLTVEEIQKVVADFFDIRLGDMTSIQRPANIAFPRQVAMYLSREMTQLSLPSIGLAFARNHATVIHAHRQVSNKLKSDAMFRQSMLVLQQRLARKTAHA
jgi:chromosomal replication initiator protein